MKNFDPFASGTSYYLQIFWWCILHSVLFGFWTSSFIS